jgi:hypothetical protein
MSASARRQLKPRLCLEVEPEMQRELVEWAREESRSTGNLVRRLLGVMMAERRRLVPSEPREVA